MPEDYELTTHTLHSAQHTKKRYKILISLFCYFC
jgi:hypothetical protein